MKTPASECGRILMHVPTPSQERVLAALREITADGWPATVREIGAACGHASPSTTQAHLHGLRHAGLAVQHPRNEQGGWLPAHAA